ncbi:MAG TPA: peptidyl-alpha-hydroxyglycine alpha-amidating lyase family protein [Bryobacteraceae bacterium]|nr:peptidyl-alpha-hydroxyglycine alpha-amidating lyase family protein [Bryobacteraceae bacterium]
MKRFIPSLAALVTPLILAPYAPAQQPLPYHPVENWAKLPAGWNFGECSGVAVDKSDNVWVFNRGPHPVVEFDRAGKFLKAFSEVPVVSSHGIRVDPEGNVWLIDVAGHKVLKMSPEGRVLLFIGGVGNAPGDNESTEAFNRPTNIAFGPNGTFFVSDGYVNSRVVKFDRNGDFIAKWGRKGNGDGEFNLVHDVVLDKRGRVIVADRNNDRIQVFDQNGKFIARWDKVGTPWGLDYVASEDAVYVADGKNDRVVKVNMEGQVVGTLGGHGKGAGKFDFPHSIAVDSAGAVYVAEIKNWRVQKFVK